MNLGKSLNPEPHFHHNYKNYDHMTYFLEGLGIFKQDNVYKQGNQQDRM